MHRSAEISAIHPIVERATRGAPWPDLARMVPGALLPVLLMGLNGCAQMGAAGEDRPASTNVVEQVMDSVMAETMSSASIPGAAIVVVQDGRVVLSRGYGVADVASGRPVTPGETVFRIGSVTKVLTALALARLIDEGRIELDAPVSRYVPGSELSGPGGEPVRIRHLLSHSGGFDQVGLRRQVSDPAQRPTLGEFVGRELRVVRRPGVVGVYDTYGITLAGHVVERVTGMSYSEYMRSEIFGPLGMERSWVEVPAAQRPLLATGYEMDGGVLAPAEYEWYVTLPASSVDATAEDMGRLLIALLNDGGSLFTPGLAARVRSERLLTYGDMGAFSWGFWEAERGGYRAIHHGGIMAGYSSELYLVPSERFGFFVAYNRDPETGPPAPLRENIIQAVHEKLLPARPARAAPDPPPPVPTEHLAGAYGSTVACYTCEEGEGWPITSLLVAGEGPGQLSMYGGAARLTAIDSTTFFSARTGNRVKFLLDEQGRVRYLVQGPNSFAKLDEVLLDELLGPSWREEPAHPLVARVHFAREDWRAAARAYGSLTERHPENGRYHFNRGFALLHTGDYSGGEAAFRRALEVGQWSAWSQYYIAAARAGSGDLGAAWAALARAIEMGFSDANLLRSEPWWEPHAGAQEYREALARLEGGA